MIVKRDGWYLVGDKLTWLRAPKPKPEERRQLELLLTELEAPEAQPVTRQAPELLALPETR
jgi:hypothetical protein